MEFVYWLQRTELMKVFEVLFKFIFITGGGGAAFYFFIVYLPIRGFFRLHQLVVYETKRSKGVLKMAVDFEHGQKYYGHQINKEEAVKELSK